LGSGEQSRTSERSRAISLYVSGASLGTIVALLASPIIVLSLGWPVVFYISGVLGLLWLAIWMLKAADDPENCVGVSAQELALIGLTVRRRDRRNQFRGLQSCARNMCGRS